MDHYEERHTYKNYFELLKDSLPSFSPSVRGFGPPTKAGNTTATWAKANLSSVKLRKHPGTLEDDQIKFWVAKFCAWRDKHVRDNASWAGAGPACLKLGDHVPRNKTQPTCLEPGSEQDSVDAFRDNCLKMITNELHPDRLGHPDSGWTLPKLPAVPRDRAFPVDSKMKLVKSVRWECGAEQSTKNRSSAQNVDIENLGDTGQVQITLQRRASVSQVPPSVDENDRGGSRVDGLIFLSYSTVTAAQAKKNATMIAKNMKQLTVPGLPIPSMSKRQYLRLDEKWDLNKHGEWVKKGILPIEYKRYGTLNKAYIYGLALSGLDMAHKINGRKGQPRRQHRARRQVVAGMKC